MPQAKLLSHELALSLATVQQSQQQRTGKCQNALVPPDSASTRTSADSTATKMAQTLVPVGLSESVTSTSHCLSQYYSETLFHKLPLLETITSNTSTTIPICKCLNCQIQQQMPSSMTQSTMVNSSEQQHSQPHSWSWHNLIKSSPDTLTNESFITLLSSATANDNSIKFNLKNKKLQSPSPLLSSQSSKLSSVNKIDTETNGDQNKKRSYSDSDVLLDYFNINQIQQLQRTINAGYHTVSAQYLPQTESGLIVKNGRSMPKPLHKPLLVQSEHSTPQDSPLDLSVKSLNAQLINESDPHYHHYDHYHHHHHHQYSNLFKKTKKIAFNNSCSVPSLTTIPYTSTKQHFQYSQTSVFQPNQSFKVPKDEVFSSYKRRNNSQSESISSSSLSSLVTSPQYPMPGTSLKLSKSDDPVPMCGATASAAGSDDKLDIGQSVTSASIVSLTDILSKSFTCTICGQTFTLHDRLAKHIASRHKNRQQCDSVSKNYLCEICQRSFARSDMLTRHMRLHTGIKPYTCKICDQVFSRSDHLSTHQRTHTGEKPYKCPQCPYAACRRDMITRHMRTHSRHYETPDSSSSTEELSK